MPNSNNLQNLYCLLLFCLLIRAEIQIPNHIDRTGSWEPGKNSSTIICAQPFLILLPSPVIEILNRRPIAERRMLTSSIIKDINLSEAGSLYFSMDGERRPSADSWNCWANFLLSVARQFFLRRLLSRAGYAIFSELALKRMVGVLAAAIRVPDLATHSA